MPNIFGKITGYHGRIEIPDLGAVIGEMTHWELRRRGNPENSRDPEADYFDLHADLRFVNEALFDDPDYERRVIIQGGRGQTYLVEVVPGPGQRTALTGRSLKMERIKTCRL